MKQSFKKITSVCIALLLLVGSFCVAGVPAEAASALTCSEFITNTEHRTYIDTMMQYYLDANPKLQTALSSGKSVIFMFEGGSDNYPTYTYDEGYYNVRNQATCIVVQKVNGVNKIVFYSENCSSVPSQPQDTSGGHYDRQTTILDGIYSAYTFNHTGPYGALQLNVTEGYYTPPSNLDGAVKGANGINVHTRANNYAQSGGGAWSWGCQVIGYGQNSSNVFNEFIRVVAGINYDVYTSYYQTITEYNDVGYYVLDRQLALEGLENLYTTTALNNITAASREAKEAALTTKHVSTSYATYGTLTVNKGSAVRDMPCTAEVDSTSTTVETTSQKTYEAIELCKNDQNELWYKVNLKSGNGFGYLSAADTTAFTPLDGITISEIVLPDTIDQGNAYPLSGTVTSKYVPLKGVDVKVSLLGTTDRLTGQGATNVGLTSVDFRSTSLSIGGSNKTLDDTVVFNDLEIGTYELCLTATATIHYAEGTTVKETMQKATQTVYFSMVDGTCTHNFEVTSTLEPTCISEGYSQFKCTKCNSTKISDYTTTSDHSYASATCTTPETCTVCGETKGSVNEDKHTFGDSWVTDANAHWKECACGTAADSALHDYKDGNICSICGYENTLQNGAAQDPADAPSDGEAEEEGGCSSSVASLAVVSTAILGLGIGFIRKKKDEE